MQNNNRRKFNPRNKGNHRNKRNFNQPFLPSTQILEQYEAITPGSSEKIIDMVDIEQDHRQNFEKKALSAYVISYRLGQTLGFLSILAILYAGIFTHKNLNDPELAKIIILAGFSFHAFVAILSIKRKKFFQSPRKRYRIK